MAKEARLYAKLTLDFADSHKIAPLSDAAFRAYIRMLLWSRRMLTDGKVPGPMARYFAKPKVLAELTSNDPATPSLIETGGDYLIHDFAEHQMTKAEVEAKQETNRRNGAAGGRAKAKRSANDSVRETEATSYTESESESETHLTDMTDEHTSGRLGNREGAGLDWSEIISVKAAQAGIHDTAAVWRTLTRVVGPLGPGGTVELVEAITARAKGEVRDVDAYVATACRNSPDEVRWDYDRLDLGQVA